MGRCFLHVVCHPLSASGEKRARFFNCGVRCSVFGRCSAFSCCWNWRNLELKRIVEPLCKKQKTTETLHHSTIRRTLNIQWHQVCKERIRIRNTQVRYPFCNISKIEYSSTREQPPMLAKLQDPKMKTSPRNCLEPGCNYNYYLYVVSIPWPQTRGRTMQPPSTYVQ